MYNKLGTRQILVVALGLLLAGATASAESKKEAKATKESKSSSSPRKQSMHDQMSGQGYGLAGCGLGSIVFGAKPGMIQVIAATVNGTAGSQTFGISSGTSNCDIPEMGQQAARFIEVNREIVMKEAARGEGDTLVSLSQLFHCSDSSTFSNKLQSNYQHIFGDSSNAYTNVRRILETIENNSDLKRTCQAMG